VITLFIFPLSSDSSHKVSAETVEAGTDQGLPVNGRRIGTKSGTVEATGAETRG
jgi:hypothetical protein